LFPDFPEAEGYLLPPFLKFY